MSVLRCRFRRLIARLVVAALPAAWALTGTAGAEPPAPPPMLAQTQVDLGGPAWSVAEANLNGDSDRPALVVGQAGSLATVRVDRSGQPGRSGAIGLPDGTRPSDIASGPSGTELL